jgi:hypothetical protein
MSVGNQTQAVNFGREQLTLVLGENLDQGGDDSGSRNGTGKTTIVNALSFALYGQALTNIKKDNLINKINNKNMLVTLHFEKDGIDYRIERGRKPTIMKFFVDNPKAFMDYRRLMSSTPSAIINEVVSRVNHLLHDIQNNEVAETSEPSEPSESYEDISNANAEDVNILSKPVASSSSSIRTIWSSAFNDNIIMSF